jgi:hypothetical protein
MNICLRCFEMKEMFHGRDCKECRKKYLHQKWLERNKKTCPICKIEHNIGSCQECSDKCKILNRHLKINGCWEWQGKLSNDGYGSFQETIDGKKIEVRSHRRSFEIFKGHIPEEMQVCHSCDNPSCCNPDHLWLGTAKENTQDSFKKGRRPTLEKRARAAGKLTEEEVIEMRKMYKDGSSQRDLQDLFGISQSQTQGILSYRYWKHI